MPNIRVLIAAAGKGSRAGLPYPKTLHPVERLPILIRLLDRLRIVDERPTVVVSPAGRREIERCISEHDRTAELVVQPAPTGMGDAVLQFRRAEAFEEAEHVLLVWGDIPFIAQQTVEAVCARHLAEGSDFTFPTRHVNEAYTIVQRDAAGRVADLIETREAGLTPEAGERDIGLFLFRPDPVFDVLGQRLDGGRGGDTGEHGFLYVVRHLVERGFRVEALPVATEQELISLNRLEDLSPMPRPKNVPGSHGHQD